MRRRRGAERGGGFERYRWLHQQRGYNRGMWRIGLLAALQVVATVAVAQGCGFHYDPIATPEYYRASGWALPGTSDAKTSGTPPTSILAMIGSVPGTLTESLLLDESYNIIEFPAQEFVENGAKKRMRASQFSAGIVRWEVDGHVVAYSYILVPAVGHRTKGKWRIDSLAGCIFTGTFIDDVGDGVFRLLVPGTLKTNLIPQWARPAKPL